MSHETNAKFYGIPAAAAKAMHDASKEAASEFWAHPGEGWQWNFEECWLRENGHPEAAEKAAKCAEEST